jgi:hypothetical protein
VLTIRHLPLVRFYIFNVLIWAGTLFWGFDKKQIVRDLLPASLGLAYFTTLALMFLWANQENVAQMHKTIREFEEAASKE